MYLHLLDGPGKNCGLSYAPVSSMASLPRRPDPDRLLPSSLMLDFVAGWGGGLGLALVVGLHLVGSEPPPDLENNKYLCECDPGFLFF